MKKITRRTIICLFLALLLALGVGAFTLRWFTKGQAWVSFAANEHFYHNGVLRSGTVLDRDGVLLAQASDDGWHFNDSSSLRRANLHAAGDGEGKIGVGATNAFAGKLSGYNFVTGAKPVFGGGRRLYLTVDAAVNQAAYDAMGSRKGCVGLYNYRTGEMLCMVSMPSYDPSDPPNIQEGDEALQGAYINRLLSASFIPGSTFKLVTAAAALENLKDAKQRTFTCNGSLELEGSTITCPTAHGEMTLGQALTVSCNCVFAELAVELGPEIMEEYARSTGMTNSYSVSGLQTRASTFDFFNANQGELGWSGVGQGFDLVNPCAMLIYAGAIANGGRAALPQLISRVCTRDDLRISLYLRHRTPQLVKKETAADLKQMMLDNVTNKYGAASFPAVTVGGKSGTAEDGSGNSNAWFVGFVDDPGHPWAFVVFLEGGGSGAAAAGGVASRVLQAALNAGL